ncbi:MAG TPA: hypothetical protein VF893_07915 [Candidatus Bathyarchaeia archaeon]
MTPKQSTLFPETESEIIGELSLADAERLANQIKAAVETHCDKIEIAGSIRRRRPVIHDIDFVAVAKTDTEWQKINEELRKLKAKPNCAGSSLIKAYVPCQNGLFQVDFYRAKAENYGIHLLIRTGSADHNMWLAGVAISKGMRLKYSEGLIKEGKPIAGETEESVFAALSLPRTLPSEREIVNGEPTKKVSEG